MLESNELQEARHFLHIFEQKYKNYEGLEALTEALLIIADIRESGENERERRIADNLFLTYAKKAEERAEELLSDLDSISEDDLERWHEVMRQFVDDDMQLPKTFLEKKKKLISEFLRRILQNMTPYEKQRFLNELGIPYTE